MTLGSSVLAERPLGMPGVGGDRVGDGDAGSGRGDDREVGGHTVFSLLVTS